jgi:hypothetical protein
MFSNIQHGAHIGCYARANPPRVALSIDDLVNGDPVLARVELCKALRTHVSASVLDEVIDRYNKQLMQQWQRHCEIWPEGK